VLARADLAFIDDVAKPGSHIELGSGSYGVVYLGKMKGERGYVAIKLLHAYRVNEQSIAAFDTEVRVMRRMQSLSNCTVRVKGTYREGKTSMIVMEHMENGDLGTYLKRHPTLVASIHVDSAVGGWAPCVARESDRSSSQLHHTTHHATPLCAPSADTARAASHLTTSSCPVMSCTVDSSSQDLKSFNCLLDDAWNVKLSNFGFAHSRENLSWLTDHPMEAGSCRWMAPQLVAPQPDTRVSYFASDVWSFGWILAEILTHRLPFVQLESVPAIIDALMHLTPVALQAHMPKLRDACPAVLRDSIHSCLQVDPMVRLSLSQICAHLAPLTRIISSNSPHAAWESIVNRRIRQPGRGAILLPSAPRRAVEERAVDDAEAAEAEPVAEADEDGEERKEGNHAAMRPQSVQPNAVALSNSPAASIQQSTSSQGTGSQAASPQHSEYDANVDHASALSSSADPSQRSLADAQQLRQFNEARRK
jgi:serine/threonine protein kinase